MNVYELGQAVLTPDGPGVVAGIFRGPPRGRQWRRAGYLVALPEQAFPREYFEDELRVPSSVEAENP